MFLDVDVKLNPGVPWQKQRRDEESFHEQAVLKDKEEM
jgi:hypothetical protein